jgi:hypothetical protein
MTLDGAQAGASSQDQSLLAIDEIFRRHARRRPAALAIADPPNRETFTDGAPRRMSYAQADRAVEAIAARLRHMGLPADAIVGIQLPNIAEHILAMLGAMRAGLIAAPLPLLWRRADIVAALARIGAKALITCGHVGRFNHGQLALRVALEVFSIRYVGGFGANLPDGMVSFDDLLAAEKLEPTAPDNRERSPAARIAVVSFDIGERGVVPVARSHLELLAGGLDVLLASGLAQDAVMLSTMSPSSFAGICLTLLPWILSGGTLLLHHPFNSNILGRQWRNDRFAALILPAPVAFCLAGAGAFAGEGPNRIIAAWRSPERMAASPDWVQQDIGLIDVAVFGESGLVAGRRDANGRPAPLRLGPVTAPPAGAEAVVVLELAQTEANGLAMRGPMVPHHIFPPGIDRSSLPYFKIGRGGLVDSGYRCRVDAATNTLVLDDPPATTVGGYRFPLHDLQDVVGRVDGGAKLTAVPDAMTGQRLIGRAADRATVRAALNAVGVNPLVVAAFADGGEAVAARPRSRLNSRY